MEKQDYLSIILDNIQVFGINLPENVGRQQILAHLNKFDINTLKIVAGFNQLFLEHFLIISKGREEKNLKPILAKMDAISQIIGPTGNLNYLMSKQIEYILTKIEAFKINEITETTISKIADEQLEKEFGANYLENQALENQLASAAFYLLNQGYSEIEIQEKLTEVKQNPTKLDAIFSLPPKEIYSLPPQIRQGINSSNDKTDDIVVIDQSNETEAAINQHIKSIHQEITKDRAEKVNELMEPIIKIAKDKMTEQYESVYRQIHPDRLSRAIKIFKSAKKKSLPLLLDWFFCSHLLSSIELKVEHWQVSSQATRGQAGVYTAGIDFSRYDNIVKDFSDSKLSKVINIARHILRTPSKRAIQKLGQDLTAETGFDEHLYFTD